MPGQLRASKYRHTVLHGKPTVKRDGSGQVSYEFANRPIAAKVETISGNETRDKDQVTASLRTRVTVRYTDQIAVKDRLQHGSRVLGVLSVSDAKGLRRETVCECSEISDG